MNSFLAVGALAIVMAFCGIGDRIKQMSGGTNSGNASNSSGTGTATSKDSVEKPSLTASQKSIQDSATEVKWDDQGITFKVPSGFAKMDVKKESFNYGSPATGFLIASISVMPDSFPADVSIKATYDSALEQLKQGKYKNVRWLEIDGVKGVEWVESPPEEKDGIRRHQWIAFRKYQGQNQQLNIILSTDQTKFDKQEDAFAAILYSLTAAKG
ncbi:MAG TPA: hypothetical protein PLK77_19095 [Pyrinomonadaceae bacterium]|jgi:hypothetical protein|nr:hypothetical protein [Pyrinomonadaceae bacterium]